MKATTNNSVQVLNFQFGGGGAKKYISPRIESILLDRDISLALESSVPPLGPGESVSLAPEYINNDPYRTSLV